MDEIVVLLKAHGVAATPQRIAVAQHVLRTTQHPSADEVWAGVRRACPTISRATVYNTLNLLVDRGLLRAQTLRGDKVIFDPLVSPHHHFIDEETGKVHDIPWNALKVSGHRSLPNLEVREFQVVMRGRRKK